MKKKLRINGLHTVCEEARCPNINECFLDRTATFLLMGNACTRSCGFCSVKTALKPSMPDPQEAGRIADTVLSLGIRYAVLTSVTRDDLPDGGAEFLVSSSAEIRSKTRAKIELLFPDFMGNQKALETLSQGKIDVFGHNVEMVRRLYPLIRPSADYQRSLRILSFLSQMGLTVKTGFMAGLGESVEEIKDLIRDIAETRVSILTIGQYFQPSRDCSPVEKYYSDHEFTEIAEFAKSTGIKRVFAGRFVRSSYKAAASYG